MAGTKISRQKLNRAIKEFPVPVQEHFKRCRMIANFLVERVSTEDWFLDAKLNADSIRFAVSIHDIGKLRVPKDSLYAEANVHDPKNAVYRSHAEEGIAEIDLRCGTILEEFGPRSLERYVYNAVLEHHERFDGQGFPKGLAGKDISIVGRITAIVDAIDNIFFVGATAERDIDEGIEKLKEMTGTYFDPELMKSVLDEESTFRGFISFIESRQKNKRKDEDYGLQFTFSPVQNIRENVPMAWCADYIINDPYFGPVKSETFMPVAESSRQAGKLSKLIVERVCILLDKIRYEYGENVLASVKIAASPLSQKTYVPDLCKILKKYNIKKTTFCLVFDEGGLIGEENNLGPKIMELRDGGFSVAVATSPESATVVTSLDKLPVDYLFLDKRMTARIPSNPNTYGMVSGILDIAHNLHVSVVFMGVDEREIEIQLLKLQAKYSCGELYGRSLTEKELFLSVGDERRRE